MSTCRIILASSHNHCCQKIHSSDGTASVFTPDHEEEKRVFENKFRRGIFLKDIYQSLIGNLLTCYNEPIPYNNAIKKKYLEPCLLSISKKLFSLETFCIRSGTLFVIKQITNVNHVLERI
jgi:hypothetical protein